MRRSCVHVYVHFVWRTWDSLPLIDRAWEDRLHACVAESARDIGCHVLRVGGIEDHLHALVRLNATVSVAQAAKQMKGESSHFATHVLIPNGFFKWQGTYGAFSVDPADVTSIIDYINRQREHHAASTILAEWERTDDTDSESA